MISEGKHARAIFLAILIAAAMGIRTVGAAPSDPTARLEPARLEVRSGEAFEVQVMIDDVQDLGGFEFTIVYDPAVIEVTDVDGGDLLGSTGRMEVPVGPQIREEEGTLAFGALGLGEEAGPDGSGVLATIAGTALKEGSSALSFQKIDAFTTAPERLSVQAEDGEIIVNAAGAAPSAPADAAARTPPWPWILGGVLLAVVAAVGVALAVLRRKPREASGSESE